MVKAVPDAVEETDFNRALLKPYSYALRYVSLWEGVPLRSRLLCIVTHRVIGPSSVRMLIPAIS